MTSDPRPIRLAIVGVGKIARDQHVPAIRADPRFDLVATASHHGEVEGVEAFRELDDLLAARPDVQAVSLCQPPTARFAAAQAALLAGKHVFMEKPPGATVLEVEALKTLAAQAGVTLFASWHSRFAPAVLPVRAWLADKTVRSVRIVWREDVRHWHPGQRWLWEAGGFGVFDPAINAFSIATELLAPFFVTGGRLSFPSNSATPIAGMIEFRGAGGAEISADLDFRQTGPQTWDMRIQTDRGLAILSLGGARLSIDGVEQALSDEGEYPALYRRFANLVAAGQSDADVRPLQLVGDALTACDRETVEAFHD